jgi:hypothetical protein
MSGKHDVPAEVTPEMIAAGVDVFDALSGSYAPSGLVEQIYIAMRGLEPLKTLRAPFSKGAGAKRAGT